MTRAFLSVVIPCYNEADNLPLLLERLQAVLNSLADMEFEILLVDDGSTDCTAQVIEQSRRDNPHIGYIRFVRNFGHQSALSAGLEHARGDVVIAMDADLQHPPELIPQMLALWREGYDVVQALRRSQPGIAKSLSSRMFYKVLNRVSETPMLDGAADFRLMSRRALAALLALPERSRFVRGLVAWLGFPTTAVVFDAPSRHAGRSRYTVRKMISLAETGLVTLSSAPLRLALFLAGTTLLCALVYGVYIISAFARGVGVVRGWPSTIFLVLIMGSVNLVCTGIVGIYLQAALVELRRRPNYVILEYTPSVISSEAASSKELVSTERAAIQS
jgi:glycosyltransferase involved in cell wall biosynthesis